MLETKNLAYQIRDKFLIRKINLSFKPGMLYGILGLNGAGKSTLLKTLAGIWKPTEGEVLWNGNNLLNWERRTISRTISWVPQNPQIHFNYTVEEFVMMGSYPLGKNLSQKAEISKVLKMVDVESLQECSITRISSGERQRVYIARALVTQAPILVFDEPTACLDIRHQSEVWMLLRKLLKRNKIIITALHDLQAAQRHCDEVVLLHHGKCLVKGQFYEVVTPQRLHDIFGLTSRKY